MVCHSQLVSPWEIMKRFSPANFLVVAQALEMVTSSHDPSAKLESRSKELGIVAFSPCIKMCADLELKASEVTIDKILALYGKTDATYREQEILAKELQGRIVDEMLLQSFFALNSSEALRFNYWASGWEDILDRFPEASRDVEEMNKCFALSRYTASMFHALHVAEWGAIHLGDFIGISDPLKGWRPTEKKLKDIVDAGHSKLPPTLTVDHAANNLVVVFNAEFTPDIAEHIISAVRIYMQRLVEGIPV